MHLSLIFSLHVHSMSLSSGGTASTPVASVPPLPSKVSPMCLDADKCSLFKSRALPFVYAFALLNHMWLDVAWLERWFAVTSPDTHSTAVKVRGHVKVYLIMQSSNLSEQEGLKTHHCFYLNKTSMIFRICRLYMVYRPHLNTSFTVACVNWYNDSPLCV